MSKYVSTKLEKIEKLVEELNMINTKIQSYINILEYIKEKNDIFKIYYQIISDIESNKNIMYFKNFFIQFDNNYSYNIFPRPYFEKQIPDKFQNIVDIIKKEINVNDLNNCILDSIKLYKEIDSIYCDIKLKYGYFALNSKKIIDYFKKMTKEQIKEQEDNYSYGYFSMRKDNKLEVIDLVFKNSKSINNYLYQVKFPPQEEINKIYNQKNINKKSSQGAYIDIFKDEFIKLNKIFCDFFNISKDSIIFHFYSYTNFNVDYSKSDSYNFYINSLDKDNMDIIIEKINLEKQLNNF